MYAVVEAGGKQYKVARGDVIKVEKLPAEVGDEVELERVLLVRDENGVKVGTPTVEGAKVWATVTGHDKHRKVIIFKYRPKQRYRKKAGHRQPYTSLLINDIVV